MAGGADGIRIAKCESAQDVHTVEKAVEEAKREFGVEVSRTLLMAALAARQIWLLYFNRTLLEQGIITEKQHNQLKIKIQGQPSSR